MRSKILDMKYMEIWCQVDGPTGIAIFDNLRSDLMPIGVGALRELITILLPGYEEQIYIGFIKMKVEDLQIILNAVNADRERYKKIENEVKVERNIKLSMRGDMIVGVFKI